MVSIVIPLYNKAQSIAGTIRCIQAQTYQDFEIVVVEGWSTDGSTEIINELAAADGRIRVLMQVNRAGVTPARNESIEAARSDRVVFIDADDYWEPAYLETMVKLMDDYPDAGMWGLSHGEMVCGNRYICGSSLPPGFRGVLDASWRYGCPYWTSATAVSKSAVEKIGGFDNRIIYGEDIDLWYRLMLEFPCVFAVMEPLSFYRTDAENRACNQVFPLKKHIPYYIDKYEDYRKRSADFRKFFDTQMIYRLFPYALEDKHNPELRRVLSQIDFSQLKMSMRWRFRFPKLYTWYRGKDA